MYRNNQDYISYINDTLAKTYKYEFTGEWRNGGTAFYEIQYDNGYDTYYWFTDDGLNIQAGDFVNEYERIE